MMDQFVPDLDKGKIMYFLFTKSEAKHMNMNMIIQTTLAQLKACLDFYQSMYFSDQLRSL